MGRKDRSTILFLCTSNHFTSRYAEILFNHMAGRLGFPWQATSKGLALEQSKVKGAMAKEAVQALKAKHIQAVRETERSPAQVSPEDLEKADLIIALNQSEHQPLIAERFPQWAENVELWKIEEAPTAFDLIEEELSALIAKLLGGSRQDKPKPKPPAIEPQKKTGTAKVGRETKGRRGKGVTTVAELPLNEAELRDLATRLKQICGTGGTVKNNQIEIQGDHRDRIIQELTTLGYKAKRTGG